MKFLVKFSKISSLVLVLGLAALGANAAPPPGSFSNIVKPLLPAVVNISTTSEMTAPEAGADMPNLPEGHPLNEFFKHFMDEQYMKRPRKSSALGSGFIIDPKGYIVTSNHLVQDMDEVSVTLHGDDKDTKYPAEIVGTDPRTDLALLKIDVKEPLPFVKWGDSEKADVGDWVIAIGNPFGLSSTVTAGIVSTISRDIGQMGSADYVRGFLQTDAPINQGNSGGPMFNLDGEVIGVNTAILSTRGGGSIGLGFAIPAKLAKKVTDQLKEHGRTRRGWLGVRIQPVTDEIAETLGLKETYGALVASVNDKGPGAKAGIKTKDVIRTFNGKKVETSRNLPQLVGESPIGQKLPVQIWRGGKMVTLNVVLGEFESAEDSGLIKTGRKEPSATKKSSTTKFMGMHLQELTSKEINQLNLDKDTTGVLVRRVYPGTEAHEKGVRGGDVIVEFGGKKVTNVADLLAHGKAMEKAKTKHVLVLIKRGPDLRFMTMKIDEQK
ncbi:MAG: Do family serine endopeptidase [Alphaproteobacteria bacterium]